MWTQFKQWAPLGAGLVGGLVLLLVVLSFLGPLARRLVGSEPDAAALAAAKAARERPPVVVREIPAQLPGILPV